MKLLVQGNGKLGKEVWKTSLRAVDSCPGASAACRKDCYAMKLQRFRPNVGNAWSSAFALAMVEPELYERQLTAEIDTLVRSHVGKQRGTGKDLPPVVVRIHESGDFFSVEYIRMWGRLLRRHSPFHIQFYAYTRSWAVPELLPELELLRLPPLMNLWASWDASMEQLPPAHWRVALMLPKGVEKAERYTTCPEQTGKKASCSDCRLCWDSKLPRLAFIRH